MFSMKLETFEVSTSDKNCQNYVTLAFGYDVYYPKPNIVVLIFVA